MMTIYCTDRELNDLTVADATCAMVREHGDSRAAVAAHRWPQRRVSGSIQISAPTREFLNSIDRVINEWCEG